MPLLSLLLGTLLLALAVAAKPIVFENFPTRLPVTRRLNVGGAHNLLQRDQARARHLVTRASTKKMYAAQPSTGGVVLDDTIKNAAVIYTASIGVGTPPTTYDLVIDTGSSNTWMGANKPFHPTNSTKNTLRPVEVTYGSGSFFGLEMLDAVTIAPGLTLKNQSIGVAVVSYGFQSDDGQGVDGILGIGPVNLTKGTLFGSDIPISAIIVTDGVTPTSDIIPTVVDTAYEEGFIRNRVVGISFEPTTVHDDKDGEIAYGGVNNAMITGEINYTPITNTSISSNYWGINQSITYGDETNSTILEGTAGIVDTGTTLILIATKAFERYKNVTGAVPDSKTGLLKITQDQFANLKSLYFKVNDVSHEIIPDAQVWPRALNSEIGGSPGDLYLIVNDLGEYSGRGLDFINGFTFLQRYYSVYDTDNHRVGLATTRSTFSIVNNAP